MTDDTISPYIRQSLQNQLHSIEETKASNTTDTTPDPEVFIAIDPSISERNKHTSAKKNIIQPLGAFIIIAVLVATVATTKMMFYRHKSMTNTSIITHNISLWVTSQATQNYDSFSALSCPDSATHDSNQTHDHFPNLNEFNQKISQIKNDYGEPILDNISGVGFMGNTADALTQWHFTHNPAHQFQQKIRVIKIAKNNWCIAHTFLAPDNLA